MAEFVVFILVQGSTTNVFHPERHSSIMGVGLVDLHLHVSVVPAMQVWALKPSIQVQASHVDIVSRSEDCCLGSGRISWTLHLQVDELRVCQIHVGNGCLVDKTCLDRWPVLDTNLGTLVLLDVAVPNPEPVLVIGQVYGQGSIVGNNQAVLNGLLEGSDCELFIHICCWLHIQANGGIRFEPVRDA
jgi:hypothetical protein